MPAEEQERPVPKGAPPPVHAVPVDLRDDGVLFMINVVLFHPRGFALAYDTANRTFWVEGDGAERWAFAEGPGTSETALNDVRWAQFEQLLERARTTYPAALPKET